MIAKRRVTIDRAQKQTKQWQQQKQQKGKPYFVFFSYGGKLAGQFAEVRAANLEEARCLAWKRYGVAEVGRVEHNIERAFAHITAYKLRELNQAERQ